MVAKYKGRIFKVAGDGVLVEFASAVNAVQCAVDLQQGMAGANAGQPEDRNIVLRIGVNLGDVLVEGGDLYGDGVNVAARLEGLATPGGICITRSVRDQIQDRVEYGFDDLGEYDDHRVRLELLSRRRAFRRALPGAAAVAPAGRCLG